MHVLYFLFLTIISYLSAAAFLSVCTALFHNTATSSCSFIIIILLLLPFHLCPVLEWPLCEIVIHSFIRALGFFIHFLTLQK